MSTASTIEWTNATWNPVRGCDIVSPGCTNCYAMKQAHRFSGKGKPYEGLTKLTNGGPVWTGEVKVLDTLEALSQPIGWKKPRRVFVNSMSDLFHEDVPDWFIDKVFAVMAMAPRHTFQVLTKRPARMHAYINAGGRASEIVDIVRHDELGYYCTRNEAPPITWPLPNVWLGVSVEDQKRALERIDWLMRVMAAVRFISAEPLLGELDIPESWLRRLNWVIVGGESGPGARPTVIGHIRGVVRQCKAVGTPVFVKQLGAKPVNREGLPHALEDAKGGDMGEWSEDLRVREYPG